MTGSQLEQWSASDRPDSPSGDNPATNNPTTTNPTTTNPTTTNPATAAAITVVPQVGLAPAPRPRWQRRLALTAGAGALGGLAWLGWWLFLRTPPHPYVLEFSPPTSQYAITDQKPPVVSWQISHPRQIDTLILRTLTADGALVGEPRRYDLSGSLPVELLAYCTETRTRLSCQDLPTELRQPGQYRFELTLLPRAGLNLPPVQATSSLVTISDLPLPTALELAPQQVIYSEFGTLVSANTPNLAPPVTPNGILVSWIVTHPEALQDLLLVVRQPGGTTLGGRRFSLRDPENPTQVALPEELKPFCQLGDNLVCQGVPTGMTAVGQYQFELTPIPIGLDDSDSPVTKVSEVVEIQPRPVRIAAFTINGGDAQPKYLVPVEPGKSIPGFRLDWRVEGGSTTKVELLPSPGTVGLEGSLNLPLAPAGTTTITLRVTDGQNPPILRAVTFETFNPNPNQPVIINQGGASNQTRPAPSGNGSSNSGSAPSSPPTQPQTPPPANRPTLPQTDLPGQSLQESQSQSESNPTLPEDLQNRPPEDLNLTF